MFDTDGPYDATGIDGAAPVCLGCILVFILGFALGAGPVPWTYLAEILPPEIKGPTAAIATSLNWLACIAVTTLFPLAVESVGLGPTFFVVAVINVCAALFGVRYMVETRRKNFASIYESLVLKL